MRTRILAMALVAGLPALALAQKGGAKTAADPNAISSSSSGGSGSGAKTPSSRDLTELNPAALLVDKKKKLSLADSTVNQLKAVQKKIGDRNAAFYASYDSTRKWTMSIADPNATKYANADASRAANSISPAEQARMQASMRDLRAMMADYRERRKADVADALAVVPEAQKKAAADMLSGQDGDMEKLLSGK